MPSYITHRYFAETIIPKVSEEIQAQIIHSPLYNVGAQGPDLLFYIRYNKNKSISTLGEKMHTTNEVQSIFEKSADYAKIHPKIIPFLYGQLAHYALDKVSHPYIYSREEDLKKYYPKSVHKHIHIAFESALDYIVLEKFKGKNSNSHKGHKELKCDNDTENEIAEFYVNLIAPIFNSDLNIKIAKRIFNKRRLFMYCINSRSNIKHHFFRLIEIIAGGTNMITNFMRPRKYVEAENWDNHMRIEYPRYRNSMEIYDNYTFAEQLERAKEIAIDLFKQFNNYMKGKGCLTKELYDTNYSGDKIK